MKRARSSTIVNEAEWEERAEYLWQARHFILGTFYAGSKDVNAKWVGTLAFLLDKGLGPTYDQFSDLSCDPQAQSGSFNRTLNNVLNLHDADAYYIQDVPVQGRLEECRELAAYPVLLAHEQFWQEKQHADAHEPGSFFKDCPAKWSAGFLESPVYRRLTPVERLKAIPCALYFDSTEYNGVDSFWGATLTNLVTGKVHVLEVVRSNDFCKCGCGGWCTMSFLGVICTRVLPTYGEV